MTRLGTACRDAGWTLLLPVIILGGMFGGVVTATEAAGVAVLAAFIIGTFIYREMNFRQLRGVMLDGVVQTATVMMLIVPIVMPLVRQVGVDPTHFGIIVTLKLAIGQQTPPVASVLLTACAVARQPVGKVFYEAIPFIVVPLVVLAIVTYVPIVPLFLPQLLQGR